MVFFVNLSIRNKVSTAFSAILLLTVSLGLFSITRVDFLKVAPERSPTTPGSPCHWASWQRMRISWPS